MAHYLVVGGSSGIGQALVSMLTAEDHQVSVLCQREPNVPGDISHYPCDVLTDSLPELDKEINGLAYLPGSINLKPFRQLSEEDFRHDLEINFWGAVKTIQTYLPQLLDGSSICLASTVAVGRGMPFHASIAAAKGAVEGLTRSLAAELAPKIRVNAVAPSLTDTPLAAQLMKNAEAAAKRHPLGRTGKPQDIAGMIAFLLGEKATWITGQIIGVDGGLSTLSTM